MEESHKKIREIETKARQEKNLTIGALRKKNHRRGKNFKGKDNEKTCKKKPAKRGHRGGPLTEGGETCFKKAQAYKGNGIFEGKRGIVEADGR